MKTPFINDREDLRNNCLPEFPDSSISLCMMKGIREKTKSSQPDLSWNKGFKEYFAVRPLQPINT